VFATPEYAKWTKTGGLGVMTDELSRGLATLGEDIYVITPIYDNKVRYYCMEIKIINHFCSFFFHLTAHRKARSY
jgi:glycogen synthase